MATIKAVVRKQRADGFWPVYIRVTHRRASSFFKTGKVVDRKGLDSKMEIKDPHVLEYCARVTASFYEQLNRVECENWSVTEVVEFLKGGHDDLCLSDYARKVHITRMLNEGQERNAKNYTMALQHLERFLGTNRVMFSHLTSNVVNRWIDSMRNTHRAKELYPICLRQIFKAAMLDYNDYDTGMVRIKTNPWPKVKIPKADRPEKLAISPEECRAFFAAPLPESMFREPLAEMGRDVAMMVLCLGGINTVDLYNLKKRDYKNGVICYKRAKTRKARNDDAYMEMRVPEILKPLMEKYADTKGGEYLFVFHRRHSTSDSFCANVNIGIKQICRSMGMEKDDFYSAYTFRHTWGTIAQNDCGANIHDVAFAMNHTSGFRVTRGYIKIDFTPAWELNEKVVEFIFFTDKKSSREVREEEPAQLRISPRFMVYGAAYHMGRKVAEVTDIGFRNKDEVIARLAGMLPEDIPDRSIVIFKVVNMDKDQTAVYQKQKGKGF